MSAKQITDSTKIGILEWKMAICWFVLFSVVSLASAISGSLVNSDWDAMNGQSKFLMFLAIIISWGNTLMAFFSKAAKKIDQQISGDENSAVTRTHSETDSVKSTPPETAPTK